MPNLIQDPLIVIYDNLFFGLSLGKFDLMLIREARWVIEEFILVRQVYKDGVDQLETVLPYISAKVSNMISNTNFKRFIENQGIFIQFLNYSGLIDQKLIGLGIRIISETKENLQALGVSPEDRIQKVMFLLSRGLLKSRLHRIEFENIML